MSQPIIPSLPEDFTYTPPSGLTAQQAEAIRQSGGGNTPSQQPGKGVGQILLENTFTLFNLLNFALALCLALVGSWRNMLFLGVVISNTLIGTVQELRARRTLARLQVLNAPVSQVMRDGQLQDIPSRDLVRGDVVVLRTGNQVPADGIVLEGQGAADESLLTGESDSVEKATGDWLMSGSFVTEGRLLCQLVQVGDDSYAARLTKEAKAIRPPKSALMTDLNKLIRLVSIILVPLGLLLFAKQFFLQHLPLTDAVPSAVAAMIGMIPEGLMLLTSVALAVGVVRLGQRDTLVQELYGIETLARVDTLCLDKTGTLTTGKMKLVQCVPVDGSVEDMQTALSRYIGAFSDNPNATLSALVDALPAGQEKAASLLPFSSTRKMGAAGFADGTVIALGAAAFTAPHLMTDALRQQADVLAAEGYRVLVLTRGPGRIAEGTAPADTLLGLVVLSDELRPHADETLSYFHKQGVTVKVISGDDPRTVSAIAQRLHLQGAEKWLDVSQLSDEELMAKADAITIFGRVSPRQKQLLVKALQQAGHSVAMTGDGVNDIPALKAADCSIAMPGGSDAARHAAQLTLLDGDFSAMPQVVAEGRRVVNNVTRAASLFLVKTLFSFALSLLLLVLPGVYPFQPIQLTLISGLTIGFPSFVLALAPNGEPIRGKFLQTVLTNALPGALAVTLSALCAMHMGWSNPDASSLAALCAGVVGLGMLVQVCRPFTPMRKVLVIAMAVGLIASVAVAGKLFLIVVGHWTMGQWGVALLLMLFAVVVMIGTRRVMKKKLVG